MYDELYLVRSVAGPVEVKDAVLVILAGRFACALVRKADAPKVTMLIDQKRSQALDSPQGVVSGVCGGFWALIGGHVVGDDLAGRRCPAGLRLAHR
jgi:hypothetical protein